MIMSHVKEGLQTSVSAVLIKVFSLFYCLWNLDSGIWVEDIFSEYLFFKFWVSLEEHIQEPRNNYLFQILPN